MLGQGPVLQIGTGVNDKNVAFGVPTWSREGKTLWRQVLGVEYESYSSTCASRCSVIC
jgi:hypothetical protein